MIETIDELEEKLSDPSDMLITELTTKSRTSKDYERLTDSSIAFIQLSMVRGCLSNSNDQFQNSL